MMAAPISQPDYKERGRSSALSRRGRRHWLIAAAAVVVKVSASSTSSALKVPRADLRRPLRRERPQQEITKQYLEWLNHGIQGAGLPRKSLAVVNGSIGLELAARRRLGAGEVFIRLPTEYTLLAGMEGAGPRGSWLDSHFEPNSTAKMTAALALELARLEASEAAGLPVVSFRAPMLRKLPTAESLEEVLYWARHPAVSSLAGQRTQILQADRDAALVSARARVGVESARLARALVVSRASVCGGGPVLLPTVQLMSHGEDNSGRNVEVDPADCAHRALRKIPLGEPLRISYGRRPCSSWLAQYGFLPKDAPVESEQVELDLGALLGQRAADTAPPDWVIDETSRESVRFNCSGSIVIPHRRLTSLLQAGASDRAALALARVLFACFRVGFFETHGNGFLERAGEDALRELLWEFDASQPLTNNKVEALAKSRGTEALRQKIDDLLALTQASAPHGAPAGWWEDVQFCAKRQSQVLNAWKMWLAAVTLPSSEETTSSLRFTIMMGSLVLAVGVTSLTFASMFALRA